MSSPRVRIAARLAPARLLGCRHNQHTCSRCLADAILPLLAEAWAEGWQSACDETLTGFAPDGPNDSANPYVDGGVA